MGEKRELAYEDLSSRVSETLSAVDVLYPPLRMEVSGRSEAPKVEVT